MAGASVFHFALFVAQGLFPPMGGLGISDGTLAKRPRSHTEGEADRRKGESKSAFQFILKALTVCTGQNSLAPRTISLKSKENSELCLHKLKSTSQF